MLQGTIDEFPLIDVLGILQARNKTGRLEIERQAGRGLIYVRLGEPYYAESSLTRSLIGQKLVDIGAITDMQLRKALDRQAESGERLGQILLTHGVISGEHVAQAVISQIKDALADLLAWEAGEFRWETGAEVEVEVPLFGATAGSLGEGANPLAPHVIPVNTEEPETTPEQPAQPEAVAAQPDFPQGGTTTTGDEVTASPIESFPDAGQDQSPEVVHSSPEVLDDTQDKEESIIDTWDEPKPKPEPEPVEEFESQPDPEPETHTESQPEPEPVEELESQPEPVTEPEPETHTESQPEPEPVEELESQPEPVTEPVEEFESQTEPDAPAPFHAPLVIRSQPAPELDEEFEAVFEANAHASFEVEPVTDPVTETPSFDSPPVPDPGFGVDAFKPIAPDTDSEQPIFEPDDTSTDPIFDSANFEPVPESFEPPAPAPLAEALEPVFETPEPVFETPEPVFETPETVSEATPEPALEALEAALERVQPDPVQMAPEMPAADSMAVAPSPPPPPPAGASEAEATEEAPAPAETPASPPEGVAPESLKDIKLDRSSLVRELSDLLR